MAFYFDDREKFVCVCSLRGQETSWVRYKSLELKPGNKVCSGQSFKWQAFD